ncbi:response regulator transcription factor [Streptomyces sp. NP160]|uniref:response regulator transcription factor n=1 Tax=Streptomyces sp. NP160 TaxID=2586637 RepID=UPI001118A757|nr:response regulator transcription factor [Streptomyces sp. NP160]TNM68122.1 response regulator transcription factor [Streptomyces sp. NP160]
MDRPGTPPQTAAPIPRGETPLRPDGTSVRVLVVDDEPDLADVLSTVLRGEGFECRVAHSGSAAVREAEAFAPDAVVLDVMLPDLDGFAVLERLRRADPAVAVLFLTARSALEDRVTGIRLGGDDYLTKPFHLEEVVVRLRGLLRRTSSPAATAGAAPGRQLVFEDLRLDEDTREVHRGPDRIELTATEFELLRLLARTPRKVLSKQTILAEVWQQDLGRDAHVVELYISYLRRKVDAGRTPLIHTVRGVGYVLRTPA